MNVVICQAAWVVHREVLIYRINDSPEGMEATQDRKHMLDGICNGGQLHGENEHRGVDGGKEGEKNTVIKKE